MAVLQVEGLRISQHVAEVICQLMIDLDDVLVVGMLLNHTLLAAGYLIASMRIYRILNADLGRAVG